MDASNPHFSSQRAMSAMTDLGAHVRRVIGPPGDVMDPFYHKVVDAGLLPSFEHSGYSTNDYRELLHVHHMAALWASFGFNVFDISEDLSAALLLTEPTKPPAVGFSQPFPAFAVQLPPGTIPMFMPNEQFWADTLWIYRFRALQKSTGQESDFLRMLITGRGVQLWQDRHPSEIFTEPENTFGHSVFTAQATNQDHVTFQLILHFAANLLAWMSDTEAMSRVRHPQPPPIKRKASKEARMKLEAGEWPHVWYIGREVKIGNELKQIAREVAVGQSDAQRPGWRVRMRFVVRGHHHTYRVGPGRTETILKWVAPYWKGPAGAAAWSHLYQEGSDA